MTTLDWLLVIALDGSIIVWALVRRPPEPSTRDWFLAGRRLPWWIVGLSLYATAIDSSDIVADSGGAYTFGASLFVFNWVGTVAGWTILAHVVAPPMYRAGIYTNAEWLETRFGPWTRTLSVIVQVQYRTFVVAIIGRTLFLTLSIACGWDESSAWTAVVVIAVIATVYTVAGGLESVAITDALQSIVMITASILVCIFVWNESGGWSKVEQETAQRDPALAERLFHVGAERIEEESIIDRTPEEVDRALLLGGELDRERGVIERRTPAWLVALGFFLGGLAYAIVNHTQSMRLLGARSERDLRLSVVVGSVGLIAATFLHLSVGILGRSLHPELASEGSADHIYPTIVRELAPAGLRGIIIAGILAAAFSTYDSIGSTLAALFTRDIYARFFARDKDDRHYLRVARLVTPVVIFGSFAYVPYVGSMGMFAAYLEVVGAFVVPLLAVHLLGALTPVHPRSGTIGLFAGVIYGAWAFAAPKIAVAYGVRILPAALMSTFATAPLSFLVTAGTMLVATVFLGSRERRSETVEKGDWIRATRAIESDETLAPPPARDLAPSIVLGVAVTVLGAVLAFVVFW